MKVLPAILKSALFLNFALMAAKAQVYVYVSPNDIESAEASGLVGVTPTQVFTETFETVPLGNLSSYHSSTIGVQYTSTGGTSILPSDQYGGNAEGQYLGVNAGSTVTLTLDTPSHYFGFYFTAGDANNGIEIYSGNTLLRDFNTASLISLLPNNGTSTITAINGTNYLTSDYYGQPVTGQNASEPYAYLHFITQGTDTFDRIVLSQDQNAIFENDNHSILAVSPVIPSSLVLVSVPEPGSFMMLSMAALAFGGRRKRK